MAEKERRIKLIVNIPEQMYLNAKADTLCCGDILAKAIKNGIPYETVTEFADRCRECGAKYGKLLKQQPREDCISRQAVLDLAVKIELPDSQTFFCISPEDVETLPPVNPQPKTGYWWERDTYPQESRSWDCSECQEIVFEKTNYCPNCGAKMQEVDNGDK